MKFGRPLIVISIDRDVPIYWDGVYFEISF